MDEGDDVRAAIGHRLRDLRREQGRSLEAVAETTGISHVTLSRLEGGTRRPTRELLLALARVHGVPLDEFVGAPQTGDPSPHLPPVERDGMT